MRKWLVVLMWPLFNASFPLPKWMTSPAGPRMIMIRDIVNEPDDPVSLVRRLLYSKLE